MNQKDLFTLGVRIAGIAGMMYLMRHWGYYWHRHHDLLGKHRWEMVFEIILFLVGVFMAMGIPLLMRFFFPKDKDGQDHTRH